ncbi:MAG: hypothetical protein WDN50_07090 [Bradyrhizobium sp.]
MPKALIVVRTVMREAAFAPLSEMADVYLYTGLQDKHDGALAWIDVLPKFVADERARRLRGKKSVRATAWRQCESSQNQTRRKLFRWAFCSKHATYACVPNASPITESTDRNSFDFRRSY